MRVAVIGTGLIGTSVALALREHGVGVWLSDTDPEAVRLASAMEFFQAAALLHDVVEDTDVDLEEVRSEFGDEIAKLVEGVTKLTRVQFQSREQAEAENYRKMIVAMAQDVRVILIKLADRLHNMRTIEYLGKQKQIQKAKETLEVYAPLAHRLGIHAIKWELEDLSFATLHPRKYDEIKQLVDTVGLLNERRSGRSDRSADFAALARSFGCHAETVERTEDVVERIWPGREATVEAYARELDEQARRRRQMELDLRVALRDGHFELHYQPLVEAADGGIAGAEALMRWTNVRLGSVSPARFIPAPSIAYRAFAQRTA